MSELNPGLFSAPTRYFRCPRPETYRTLVGDVVTYFSPEHPGGFHEDDMNQSECLRLAARYQTLCNEITEQMAVAIRALLDAEVAAHKSRQAADAALETERFTPSSGGAA